MTALPIRPGLKHLIVVMAILSSVIAAPTSAASAASFDVIDSQRVLSAPSFNPLVTDVIEFTDTDAVTVAGDLWHGPAFSGNGNWAAYRAETDSGARLFRVNVDNGRTRIVSGNLAGSGPAISSDGSKIAFFAVDPATSVYAAYRWDGSTDSVARLSGAGNTVAIGQRFPVAISDDGRRVAWAEGSPSATSLVVWTAGTSIRIAFDGGPFWMSGNGRYLAYKVNGSTVRRDLDTATTAAAGGLGRPTDDGSHIVDTGYYYANGVDYGWAALVTAENGDEILVQSPQSSADPVARISGDGSTMTMRPGNLLVDLDSRTVRTVTGEDQIMVGLSDDGRRGLALDGIGGATTRLRIVDYDLERPPPALVSELSEPQLSDQIARLYRAVFLREGAPADLAYWSRQRALGASIVEVAGEFVAAPEFVNRYGQLGDGDFVRLVYRNVLDREPDDGGLAFWTGQLAAGMSRAEMVVGFSDSAELINKLDTAPLSTAEAAQIWRLYQAFFLRSADQSGFDYWYIRYWNGTALTAVSDAFAGSQEFVNRYGTLSDEQFIAQVYRNVLNREPDGAGRAFWLAQLAGGMTRGEMMIGFSDSPEFIRGTDTLPPAP